MKIISARDGFASDHSSTSYKFLAVDRPLDADARSAVASLSSRAVVDRRRASFLYHGDFSDLPGGSTPLLRRFYDLMYSESYDWWTLGIAFDATDLQIGEIGQYDFAGVDDLGVYVDNTDDRVIIEIHCKLDYGAFPGQGDEWDDDWGDEAYEDDDDGADGEFDEGGPAAYDVEDLCPDPMMVLLAQVRAQLMDGDYRCLHAVWQAYGWDEEDESNAEGGEQADSDDDDDWPTPPVPPELPTGGEVVGEFRRLLTYP